MSDITAAAAPRKSGLQVEFESVLERARGHWDPDYHLPDVFTYDDGTEIPRVKRYVDDPDDQAIALLTLAKWWCVDLDTFLMWLAREGLRYPVEHLGTWWKPEVVQAMRDTNRRADGIARQPNNVVSFLEALQRRGPAAERQHEFNDLAKPTYDERMASMQSHLKWHRQQIEQLQLKQRQPEQPKPQQPASAERPKLIIKPVVGFDSDPVDLWAKHEPPTLPKGLLPQVIEDFAFKQSELMGCDPAGLAMAALAVCAAAIPDNQKIQVKKHGRWKESARVWVGLAGPVSAKKSPIMREATVPLNNIDAKMSRDYSQAMAAYKLLSKEEQRGREPPPHERIRIEDATPEAVQPILRDSPHGVLLVRDELSGWFGGIDKYAHGRGGAADRGFWLQAFNGGSYTWDRVGRGSGYIENLSVSILGGIQTDALRRVVAEGVDDGLIQRLFVILLKSAVLGTDEPLDTDSYDALVTKLRDKLARQHNPTDLQFSEEAAAIRRQLEKKHLDLQSAYERVNKKLAAHIGKYDGLYARLCLLWHVVEHIDDIWPTSISADTAQRVADFLHNFLSKHAIAFYVDVMGLSDDHDRLTAVAGYILARRLARVTRRDIQRGDGTMRGRDRRDTESVFHQLEAFGWLNQQQGRRLGDVQWHVNPAVHEKFAAKAEEEAERRARESADIVASLSGGDGQQA
jgi:uncharacterized protein DUF3987